MQALDLASALACFQKQTDFNKGRDHMLNIQL